MFVIRRPRWRTLGAIAIGAPVATYAFAQHHDAARRQFIRGVAVAARIDKGVAHGWMPPTVDATARGRYQCQIGTPGLSLTPVAHQTPVNIATPSPSSAAGARGESPGGAPAAEEVVANSQESTTAPEAAAEPAALQVRSSYALPDAPTVVGASPGEAEAPDSARATWDQGGGRGAAARVRARGHPTHVCADLADTLYSYALRCNLMRAGHLYLGAVRRWHHEHGFLGGVVFREKMDPLPLSGFDRFYMRSLGETDEHRRYCYYVYYEYLPNGDRTVDIFVRGTTHWVDMATNLKLQVGGSSERGGASDLWRKAVALLGTAYLEGLGWAERNFNEGQPLTGYAIVGDWLLGDESQRERPVDEAVGAMHVGFEERADQILDDIAGYLDEKTFVTFCGHSLGGAAGAIMAVKLASRGHPSERLRCITFGSPKFATAQAREMASRANIISVVDVEDPVPLLPPNAMGFAHVGKVVLLSRVGEEHCQAEDSLAASPDALQQGVAPSGEASSPSDVERVQKATQEGPQSQQNLEGSGEERPEGAPGGFLSGVSDELVGALLPSERIPGVVTGMGTIVLRDAESHRMRNYEWSCGEMAGMRLWS